MTLMMVQENSEPSLQGTWSLPQRDGDSGLLKIQDFNSVLTILGLDVQDSSALNPGGFWGKGPSSFSSRNLAVGSGLGLRFRV